MNPLIIFYQKKTMKQYSRLSAAAVVIGALRINFYKVRRTIQKKVVNAHANSKSSDQPANARSPMRALAYAIWMNG